MEIFLTRPLGRYRAMVKTGDNTTGSAGATYKQLFSCAKRSQMDEWLQSPACPSGRIFVFVVEFCDKP